MKDHLFSLLSGAAQPSSKVGILREYLQARLLQLLQAQGCFTTWAFHGGTALRFLYGIARFSEDLDFTLHGPWHPMDFRKTLDKIGKGFEAEGYEVQVKIGAEKIVASAFIKFPGLLHEAGLSPRRDQNFSVKIELDTRPPGHISRASTLVRRHVMLNLYHHDKPSLLSGKIHALLARPYVKGRDLYDLLWYLSDPSWPRPNLPMLNAALEQTGWKRPLPTAENWRSTLWDRLHGVDWPQIRKDVMPFLERPDEAELLNGDTMGSLLVR